MKIGQVVPAENRSRGQFNSTLQHSSGGFETVGVKRNHPKHAQGFRIIRISGQEFTQYFLRILKAAFSLCLVCFGRE